MRKFICSVVLSLLPVVAQGLDFKGELTQGGYIIGETIPGAKVSLGEQKTIAAEDGTFVIGIPRLQEEKSVLRIMLLEGIEEKHGLNIKQRDYKVQKLRGIKKKHVNPDPEHLKRIRGESAQIKGARAEFEALDYLKDEFELPVKGVVTGVYGSRRFYNGEERNWHKGVDFAAKRGTPIVAPAAGRVRLALADSFFNGNLVVLDHGHQFMTIYGHMDSITVKDGQMVKVGDQLGTLGNTGRSTGPHLHWGLYWRNMALDPMLLVQDKIKN